MDELLNNPGFQSALVPLAIVLGAGLLLKRLGTGYWTGLAVVLGIYVAFSLMVDFKLSPLTGTRKIVLLGLAAALAGVVVDVLYPRARRAFPVLLFIGGAAAVIWVIWPVLTRREGMASGLLAGGGVIYVGWLAAVTETLRNKTLPALTTVAVLGFGTGGAVLMGASALLGQMALAVGSAGGAFLLLSLFGRLPAVGATLLLPAMLLCALIGYAGVVYAKLPWYVLPLLALVPYVARVPVPVNRSRWLQAILLALAVAPTAVLAVAVTWWIEGAPNL